MVDSRPPPAGASSSSSGGDVPVDVIRPALEAAWVVARAGLAETPPVPPPGPLRPLVGFAKLGTRSLATVRAVVDTDAAFRARVVEALDADKAERPSWLWLARPPGWRDELDELVAGAQQAAHHAHETRAERSARRRLAATEEARARSDQAAEAAKRAAADRLEELSRERQARKAAEAEVDDLRARLGAAERSEAEAITAAAEARQHAAQALDERAATEHALQAAVTAGAALQDEVVRLSEALARASAAEEEIRHHADSDRRQAGAAVLDAARAADALGAALARAAQALTGGATSPAAADETAGSRPDEGEGGDPPRQHRAPPARSPRRRPVRPPGGILDDSPEMAMYLVRRPHVLVLVDGYNVSLATWPGAVLHEQRDRLTAALGELAARTGAAIHVVFDASADEQLPAPAGTPRRPVKVSFSATGEDADEVLIDLVERADPGRPVAVVTNDRRVRTEVASRGANVLSVDQLLSVLGRRPQEP